MHPGLKTLARLTTIAALLYLFLVGLDLMGLAFKLAGRDFAERLVSTTANPLVGLFIGVLSTALVQSSSTTTSMVVGLVGAEALTVAGAVPIILGANIGTSVTNTFVSLAHVSRREEFRRAFAGSTLHDFFNWLAVLVILPLELAFGLLSRPATAMTDVLAGVGGTELLNPLKTIVRPVAELLSSVTGDQPLLTLALGVALLFLALRFLVKTLRVILSSQAEGLLKKTLFRTPLVAIAAGAAMTVMVQSSSITTSAIVPLVGAGIVTLEQLFPFTIGANIGTTVTAMIAALATGQPAAVTVAFSHLLFNLLGSLVIYVPPPLRRIPLAMARRLGDLAADNRLLAGFYILAVFFLLPLALIALSGALRG